MKRSDAKSQNLSQKFKQYLPDIVIFCLAIVLLFSSLENNYLWQDEAATALLGKNILQYGIPKVYDGKNIISQEAGIDYDHDFLHRWTSWGDNYIAALSMWMFGATTIGARFLFVIFGFASIIFFYLTIKRIFASPFIQRLTILFYVTSVPFLLHARQCRYYSLVLFCSTLMLFFLLRTERSKKHWIGFIGTSFLFFHSNYFLSIAILISFFVTVLFVRCIKQFEVKEYLVGIAGAMMVSFPGLLLYQSWRTGGDLEKAFLQNLSYYFTQINDYMYPFLFFLCTGVYIFYTRGKQREKLRDGLSEFPLFFCSIVFIMIYVMLISLGRPEFFRYLIPLLPIFIILLSHSLTLLLQERKIIISLVSAVLILSNFFHAIPHAVLDSSQGSKKLKSYLFAYLYELRHDRNGPVQAIVDFLNQNAHPTDVVLMTYGDLPVKFYTDLEVHGGLAGEDLATLNLARIRWLVIRHHIIGTCPGSDGAVVQFMADSLNLNEFTPIVLDVMDTQFEHREDPNYLYFFKKMEDVPNIVIHRRG